MDKYRHVGKDYAMYDALEKVQGKVQYICDMKLPNLLHGYLVCAKVAHANIINIDVSKAQACEGVIKVYTHLNTPSTKFNSYRWIDGLQTINDERLLNEKVRFYGDRLALVVATTREIAKAASKLIKIDYEELPLALNMDEAKKDDIKIHERSNKLFEGTFECGNYQEALKNADIIIENSGSTQKISHNAMETHVALASFDSFTKKLTIYSPSQISHAVQKLCADITGMSVSKVRAIKTKMGGSFGGKTHPIPEQLTAYAAYDLKASVSLIFSRSQTIYATRTRTATEGQVQVGYTKDGKMLGRNIKLDFDSGAYTTNVETVCTAAGKKSFRLYDVPHQKYEYEAYYTNTAISGACRGYGSPQIHAYTETNVNMAAVALNIDPVELRLLNLCDPYAKDPTNGPSLGNIQIKNALLKGKELFKWDLKKLEAKNQLKQRYVKGIGVACASHGNGYFPAYPDFITISMFINTYGEIEVKAAIHDQGCGTLITMQQIVAEELDLPLDQVIMCEADTDVTPFDSAGTQACRVTFVVGKAMQNAAKELKAKLINEIKVKYQADQIVFEDGVVKYNNESYKLKDLMIKLRYESQFDSAILYTYHSIANPSSTAVNFAQVEVDTITGNVKVLETVQVHDVGQVINRGLANGQVHGGIQMGLGLALSEEYIYNKKGVLTNENFSRYQVFNASEMPEMIVDYIEANEDYGPFGAKSIGEISTIPITPAIIAAVADATGTWICDLPITPSKVINAIKNGG